MKTTKPPSIGERFCGWAILHGPIKAVIQIGSRVRPSSDLSAADDHSDWDYQVVVADPVLFEDRAAFESAVGSTAHAFVVRSGTLGMVRKLTALFSDGMIDVVILPAREVLAVREAVRSGQSSQSPIAARALLSMSSVLLGGYKMLKGEEEFGELYRFTSTQVPPPRISDREACALAEGFVCDYVAARRLIARGEFAAGQRWLHVHLAETNFRLLHELRLRRSHPSYPDARRLALGETDSWSGRVTIDGGASRGALTRSLDAAAGALRELMRALVGTKWQWPQAAR